MTSTRYARPASQWMGVLAAALIAAPDLAKAQILDLLHERTVMTAADRRCRLFEPGISAALASAQAQARGAALRAGASRETLRSVEGRALAKAAAMVCSSQEMTAASTRVRSAFEAYARLQRINYPGDMADWRADRTRVGEIRWRLAQETRSGPVRMIFGLAGRRSPGLLLAVAQFADGQAPFSARLLMRDDARSEGPYLGRPNGSALGLPLERRLPPHTALRSYAAEARSRAGSDLLPTTDRTGWAFRFPSQAAEHLAQLDPREAVAIEFLLPGDEVRRAYVEVGDFAAGRAFLGVTQR